VLYYTNTQPGISAAQRNNYFNEISFGFSVHQKEWRYWEKQIDALLPKIKVLIFLFCALQNQSEAHKKK
jgi:hypothetical protein